MIPLHPRFEKAIVFSGGEAMLCADGGRLWNAELCPAKTVGRCPITVR